jgi:hypothetical protein
MALFMWGELGSKKPQIIHEFNVYPSCPLKNNVLLHSFSAFVGCSVGIRISILVLERRKVPNAGTGVFVPMQSALKMCQHQLLFKERGHDSGLFEGQLSCRPIVFSNLGCGWGNQSEHTLRFARNGAGQMHFVALSGWRAGNRRFVSLGFLECISF